MEVGLARYPRRPGISRQKTWVFRSNFLVGRVRRRGIEFSVDACRLTKQRGEHCAVAPPPRRTRAVVLPRHCVSARVGGGRRVKGGGPTGKISWISSHFEKRRSDTHRSNISICRLQVDPPYSGRGGPTVVRDPGKNMDQVALWLAHNAPHCTVSTHMIGSLRPLTLLLIVVDLNGIYYC